ncbi:hypothetical protein GF366_03185 [Candidatus Peregrinibacteria bacterium]|nr:hypothetical protein [Candidatus Peregrinibacteria bacterium]
MNESDRENFRRASLLLSPRVEPPKQSLPSSIPQTFTTNDNQDSFELLHGRRRPKDTENNVTQAVYNILESYKRDFPQELRTAFATRILTAIQDDTSNNIRAENIKRIIDQQINAQSTTPIPVRDEIRNKLLEAIETNTEIRFSKP